MWLDRLIERMLWKELIWQSVLRKKIDSLLQFSRCSDTASSVRFNLNVFRFPSYLLHSILSISALTQFLLPSSQNWHPPSRRTATCASRWRSTNTPCWTTRKAWGSGIPTLSSSRSCWQTGPPPTSTWETSGQRAVTCCNLSLCSIDLGLLCT